jgi:signal transduction histidine kinase
MVEESVDFLAEQAAQRGIEIRVDVDRRLKPLQADARLLSHVINNLLSNAVKYNQDGGIVWITVSDEANFVQVDVRDTGIGIRVEDQERIFERFYRAQLEKKIRVEGSGLGLAIARTIVEKHRGRIWVESKPGVGSTFSFTLPRQEAADAQIPTEKAASERPPHGFDLRHGASPSEYMDDVDDNLQEAREINESDSRSDER